MFQEYFLAHHKEELTKILTSASEETKHLSLNISFVKLFENDPNLGNMILKDAEKVLENLDKALVNIQKILAVNLNTTEILDKVVHTRVYGLPSCHHQHRIAIPRSVDLHLFLQITGSVVRTTLVKMLEYRKFYKCTKCKYQMVVNAVYEQKYIIFPPKKCLNPEGCGSSNIVALNCLDASNCKDFQEIKIQEQITRSSLGNMPNSMWVTLEDDLVDMCKPGDNVTVCGIVKDRWEPFVLNKKISCDLVLKANHLQVNNVQSSSVLVTSDIKNFFHSFWKKYRNRPLLGRDIILKSICPQIYGLHTVKLALGMVLASGSRTHDVQETGVRARSESHLLLVGDPGTGKSQMLKFAAKIIPRSVLTTGVGSTSAGLTVTAIQENGEWQLEGGALVLADGGICCIDEFNSMKERDRTSIHEAMEQQTISVAKASIVCKLSTRCSILAAINPKGNFDLGQPLSLNVGVPSPLLSRFDIILILQDTVDPKWDEVVCDHILDRVKKKGKNDRGTWEVDLLRAYFSYIKDIQPNLTPQSNRILSNYYQAQRRSFAQNRVTVRLLDSLVRLSKAHARLMFHEEVNVMDAVNAVIMMESSMHGAILNLNVNSLHSPFPKDPMQSYNQLARSILEKLELVDILNDELILLTKLAEQGINEADSSMSFERSRENSRILSRLNQNYEKIIQHESPNDTSDGNNQEINENDEVKKINDRTIANNTNPFEDSESDEEYKKECDKNAICSNNENESNLNDTAREFPKKIFKFVKPEKVVENETFIRNKPKVEMFQNDSVAPAEDVNNLSNNLLKATENTDKKIPDNKDMSTKDFLSKFKFTKRERKEDDYSKLSNAVNQNKNISSVTEGSNLHNIVNNIDCNNDKIKNVGKEKYKTKRKRNIDEGTRKKKKAKGKKFDSDEEFDIENEMDWNLDASINYLEEKASTSNMQAENKKSVTITSQSSSRGLFESEDDIIENWDL